MGIVHPRYPNFDFDSLNPLDLAWAAGLFDGEGSISVQAKKKPANSSSWFTLNLVLTNSHEPSVIRMRDIFGFGTIYTPPKHPDRKQIYRWMIAARSAEIFLTAIQPYAFTKAEQVRLALEFRQIGQKRPFKKVPVSDFENACRIAAEIRSLNGKNYQKATPKTVALDYVEV